MTGQHPPDESPQPYPLPWVRAVLDLAILGLVHAQPQHGYALARHLKEAGFGDLRGGSIYPVLTRLENHGHITFTWEEPRSGPGRKRYAITPHGQARLRGELALWNDFISTLHQVTDDSTGHQP
ncbi:hypothetical protein KEM60_01288 [Austwickia sp. TVS 96-490-7B]|uniref:PadR family transcriptional regulator n=1 Tax=Austwickia sp. TVS 96-490-7B TaxID=2830843 RepID=UPI001C5978FB|nr:PadR family transcriptional regulator [Austwickia sp. TVS 96-490-7B]MBW3085095.1 hypothetical protein [Austwickia sp. TVS 96-490-7B]